MKEKEINQTNEEIITLANIIPGDQIPNDDTGEGTGEGTGNDNNDEGNVGDDSNNQITDGRPVGGTGSNGPIKDLPDRPINNDGE